jgi:hypothetical protein
VSGECINGPIQGRRWEMRRSAEECSIVLNKETSEISDRPSATITVTVWDRLTSWTRNRARQSRKTN